ncbi:hypothetical protein C6W19_06590 [Bacillus sp. RJGP41]|nr:hypothetical protein C6W19_06590 [Bacillus sp. RJGP41]
MRPLLRKARLGKPRRLPDRPRKASAYVPINVQIVQAIKRDKLDFHRVCLHSREPLWNRGFFLI